MIAVTFVIFGVNSFMYWIGEMSSLAYVVTALMLAGLFVLALLKKEEEADKEWMKQRQEARARKEEREYQKWMNEYTNSNIKLKN